MCTGFGTILSHLQVSALHCRPMWTVRCGQHSDMDRRCGHQRHYVLVIRLFPPLNSAYSMLNALVQLAQQYSRLCPPFGLATTTFLRSRQDTSVTAQYVLKASCSRDVNTCYITRCAFKLDTVNVQNTLLCSFLAARLTAGTCEVNDRNCIDLGGRKRLTTHWVQPRGVGGIHWQGWWKQGAKRGCRLANAITESTTQFTYLLFALSRKIGQIRNYFCPFQPRLFSIIICLSFKKKNKEVLTR